MGMNDTVADFLTRIRNAYRAGHKDVHVRYAVLSEKVAKVMADEGYLDDVQVVGEGTRKSLVIKIKYVDGNSVITGLERISKPSKRVYVGHREIRPVMNGLGLSILSTPAGVISDANARKQNVGGEVICNVW